MQCDAHSFSHRESSSRESATIVKLLEDGIAQLEKSHTLRPSQGANTPDSNNDATTIVAMVMNAFVPKARSLQQCESQIRLGLTPSRTKVVSRSPPPDHSSPLNELGSDIIPVEHHRQIKNLNECSLLKRIPLELVRGLIEKYWTQSLSVWQFLDYDAVHTMLSSVIAGLQLRDPLHPDQHLETAHEPHRLAYDYFMVHLLMAIASTIDSWKGGHHKRRLAMSTELFHQAVAYYSVADCDPVDEVSKLQGMLLLQQYAMVNPRCANVVILSGRVMRTCAELGLHREFNATGMPGVAKLDDDFRRRLFWTAYVLDRMVCSTLQREVSIPDAAINTRLPSPHFGSFNHIINFHVLLSQMMEFHFATKAAGAAMQDLESWLLSMEQKLTAWYNCDPATHTEMTEFRFQYGRTMLHRPSLRVRMPSKESMMIAFDSACSAAQLLNVMITRGSVRLCWVAAHYTYETAIVAWFCLRNCATGILDREGRSIERIMQRTKVFTTNLLAIADQGWPEALTLARTYERLLRGIMDRLYEAGATGNVFDEALIFLDVGDEDAVTKLLYPGPTRVEPLEFRAYAQPSYDPMDTSYVWDMDDFWSEWIDQQLA